MQASRRGTNTGFWRKGFTLPGRQLFLSWLILLLMSCIESYMPELKEYDQVLVIDASIIKGDSLQQVVISRSAPVYQPEFNPVSGCYVYVTDQEGNEFLFEETGEEGVYEAAIPQSYLFYGAEFQLHVSTPEGKDYISDPETIMESSPVDSIYYLVEEHQSSSVLYNEGLQFYADLKAPDDATKNYLWKVEETWEIHTYYEIGGFWDKYSLELPQFNPSGDLRTCWSTRKLTDHYTASTENLVVNEKKKIPMNFVPAVSAKLDHRYSLLVKQFTLSDDAYTYHSQNNFATSGDEGLYQRQPAQSFSNIRNIEDPDEIVLGYFWASSYSQQRLYFNGPLTIPHADCDYLVYCIPKQGQTLIGFFRAIGRDVYLIALEFSKEVQDSVTLWAYPPNQICIDCTANGGSTEKPEFWTP